MSLLQETETPTEARLLDTTEHPGRACEQRQHTPDGRQDDEIDLTRDRPVVQPSADERPMHGPVQIEPGGHLTWRGMRIRRVRLTSVAKLSFVFWLLAFAVLLGTAVAVWNVARAFGFITDIEEIVITSLGLDTFEVDGGALFGLAAAVTGFLCALGWLMTILLAAVYNASCAVFGGLAVETGPIQRRRRVFSLRHRGFVTIRS